MNIEEVNQLEALRTFAQKLEADQLARRMRNHEGIWKPTATAATELGYDCERRIVYRRVMPWAAQPVSPELASIFEEGKHHERQVLRELEEELGIRLRNRQSTFREPRLELVGALDAEAHVDGVGWVPVEVKGLAFIPGDDVEGIDLADAPKALHRRYFAQLQVYLIIRGLPLGLFIFKSKTTGRWRCIPVELDYERCEALLKKAERVRDATRAYIGVFEMTRPFNQDGPTTDPDRAVWEIAIAMAESALPARLADRSECAQCPFLHTCNPSQAPIDPALLIDDVELIAQLTRRAANKPARDDYERNHKIIRERFRLTAGDVWFAGDYRIERTFDSRGAQRLSISKQEAANG